MLILTTPHPLELRILFNAGFSIQMLLISDTIALIGMSGAESMLAPDLR